MYIDGYIGEKKKSLLEFLITFNSLLSLFGRDSL